MADPITGIIQAIDLAQKTGFAIGPPGAMPRSGSVLLKEKKEQRDVAMGNLIAWLQAEWDKEKPALIIREAPLPLAAYKRGKSDTIGSVDTAQDGVQIAYGLHGILEGMCKRYGIKLVDAYPARTRKHFIDHANMGSRELTKRAVIERCWLLGYFKRSTFDLDRADACSVWDWAAATYGQRSGALHLFGEKAK